MHSNNNQSPLLRSSFQWHWADAGLGFVVENQDVNSGIYIENNMLPFKTSNKNTLLGKVRFLLGGGPGLRRGGSSVKF